MRLSPLLEILAACLQVPSLLGPFKLQEGQQRQRCWLGLGSQQEGAAYLPVQSPLPPLPASGEHSKSPAKRLSLPCFAPRHSPSSSPEHPSLPASRPPTPLSCRIPPVSLLQPGTHQWPCLPGVHLPGSRASRAQSGHLAPAFAESLCGRRISGRRAGSSQELVGEVP